MKRGVQRLDETVVLRDYPTVVGEMSGWFFRARETSNNAWLGEGIDLWGRQVSHRADDPDSAIAAAVDAARVVQAHLTSASS
jgi:hypothetical protein